MILIFSHSLDHSTKSVTKLLKFYGEQVLVITADDDTYKLSHLDSTGIFFKHTHSGIMYNLLEAKSCWWRRTGLDLKNFLYENIKGLTIEDLDLSNLITGPTSILQSEARALKEYILNRVYQCSPINIGGPEVYDLNKLHVLDIAKNKGFKIPEYTIITETAQLNKLFTTGRTFITKAIANGIYEDIDNKRYYSYTELLESNSFGDNHLVFPSLVMELINKKLEIRSFYLDGHFYSMAIFSQSSEQTQVDFRKYNSKKPNRTEPYKLPTDIELKLKTLFNILNLNCGSVDLILNKENEYVFLEINPVGQYGMTSVPANYNLDNVIANYLIYGRVSKNN